MEEIIKQMENVVERTMRDFQSDFYKYDKPYMESATAESFPLIWIVAPSHTHLLKLSDFRNALLSERAVQYRCAYLLRDKQLPWQYFIDTFRPDRGEKAYKFIIDSSGDPMIIPLETAEELRKTISKYFDETLALLEDRGIELPKRLRMPVKFAGTSLDVVKQKLMECEERGDHSLLNCLRRMQQYVRTSDDDSVSVSYVSHWDEFAFTQLTDGKPGLCGGIVFHGWPETGYQENFSHQIEKRYGWAIHT